MSYVEKYLTDLFVQILLLTVALYCIYKWIMKKSKLPPGPIGLPFVGYLPFLGNKPYKGIAKLKAKYGDIIGLKFGSNYTVVFNEYNVAKEGLNHPSALERSLEVFKGLNFGFGVLNGKGWQEQRNICLHIMRNLGLGRGPWETLIKASTKDFIKELDSFKNKEVEIKDTLETVISDNVISLLLGRRMDPKTEAKELECAKNFQASIAYFGPSVAGSNIPGFRRFCERFGLLGYDKAKQTVSNFYQFSKNEVEKHRSDSSYRGVEDFINLYDEKAEKANAQGISHFFSDQTLLGNISVLYVGGADTVTSSLMWLFRLMAKYPEIQKKVQDELDEVIGTDGEVEYENRQKVPYTFAVIQEAQRFTSIVPLTSTRRAAYDFEIRGYTIPKGTMLTANMWAIHNDENVFPNPEKFQPERFLSTDKKGSDIPKLIAFSVGKRNCPGETVAWMVILQFFTAVMQKFTVSAPHGCIPNFEVFEGLVEHLKPQPLCFRERF